MARRAPHDLIGLDEAGALLDVSRWTVRRMVSDGRLAGYRVGRSIKVSATDARGMARPIPAAPRSA